MDNPAKIMLVRPRTPETSRSGIVSVQYPINIGYLASYLKAHKVSCVVRDFEVEPFSEDDFISSLQRNTPAIVGFSCMTPHIMHAGYMADLIKKHLPGVLIVIGGVHATAIPERTLVEFPQIDVVVMGEGEEVLLNLYQTWQTSGKIDDIPGIAFRDNFQIKVNPRNPLITNLDHIPFPDRKLLNIDLYKKSHVTRGLSRQVMKIAEIICCRGCPYDCIFCASKVVHCGKLRFRSSQNIIAEIDTLINEHAIEHFSFLDDTFTSRMDILKPVCEHLKSKSVSFDCLTRVSDINEEKMALLVACGCKKISFGIESGSPRILKLLKKRISLKQIEDAFFLARKYKLPMTEATFLIGGHPDETLEDIEMTKALIYKIKPDIFGIFVAVPYPGTELNSILEERGLLKEERWNEFKLFFGNPSWQLGQVPMDRLQKISKEIIYGYYFNPIYLFSQFSKIRSFKELRYWAALGISFIKTKFQNSPSG